jgi:glycosyltransferase involved in cell wall biosynthesis
VLSSRWEGSPNALIEALGLGCPVVATNCPGGVADILHHGRLAPLVPVGDPVAMAQAMAATLQQPGEAVRRKQATARFTVSRSAAAYTRALGLVPTTWPS